MILACNAQTINFQNEFVGIWACASLVHVERDNLSLAFEKMNAALKTNGVISASFKHGIFVGVRPDGNYFLDINSESLKRVLTNVPNLEIVEEWITQDLRPDNATEWLNVILVKHV